MRALVRVSNVLFFSVSYLNAFRAYVCAVVVTGCERFRRLGEEKKILDTNANATRSNVRTHTVVSALELSLIHI